MIQRIHLREFDAPQFQVDVEVRLLPKIGKLKVVQAGLIAVGQAHQSLVEVMGDLFFLGHSGLVRVRLRGVVLTCAATYEYGYQAAGQQLQDNLSSFHGIHPKVVAIGRISLPPWHNFPPPPVSGT